MGGSAPLGHAVAQAFGGEETLELLSAWGFTELADAFEERTPGAPVSSYSLDRDSETPARTVPLGWRFEGEVVARTATSHGDAWLVRTTTGTLLRVVPVFDFEASDSFLAALSSDEPDET
jgi:hypothetical protein